MRVLSIITANGKSIGEVRVFEELKVQEIQNVANAFSILLTYKKLQNWKAWADYFFCFSILHFTPHFANTMCLLHNSNIQKICIKIGYFVNLNMQGKKNFTLQLFVSVNLFDLVPLDSFYRKLLMELDFIKMVFIDFKSSFLSTSNFRILIVN